MGSGASRRQRVLEPYTSFDVLPTEYFNRRAFQQQCAPQPAQQCLPACPPPPPCVPPAIQTCALPSAQQQQLCLPVSMPCPPPCPPSPPPPFQQIQPQQQQLPVYDPTTTCPPCPPCPPCPLPPQPQQQKPARLAYAGPGTHSMGPATLVGLSNPQDMLGCGISARQTENHHNNQQQFNQSQVFHTRPYGYQAQPHGEMMSAMMGRTNSRNSNRQQAPTPVSGGGVYQKHYQQHQRIYNTQGNNVDANVNDDPRDIQSVPKFSQIQQQQWQIPYEQQQHQQHLGLNNLDYRLTRSNLRNNIH